MYEDNEGDPWDLIVQTVYKVQELEISLKQLVKSHQHQMDMIQHLLHQNQQLSQQAKELTDYVARKPRT
jgi:hypothetical protein